MLIAKFQIGPDDLGTDVTIHQRAADLFHVVSRDGSYEYSAPAAEGVEVVGDLKVETATTIEEAFTRARAVLDRLMLDAIATLQVDGFDSSRAHNAERASRLAKIGGERWAHRVVYGSTEV